MVKMLAPSRTGWAASCRSAFVVLQRPIACLANGRPDKPASPNGPKAFRFLKRTGYRIKGLSLQSKTEKAPRTLHAFLIGSFTDSKAFTPLKSAPRVHLRCRDRPQLDSGFRVQGSGFRVSAFGLRVQECVV